MRPRGLVTVGLLLAIVLLTYAPVFDLRPFEGDNLYILQWADGARLADLLQVDSDIYPEWRPLAFATVWLQYRWAGIDQLWEYFAFNMLLWITCGWLIHRIVYRLTNSFAAGLLAAAIVLTSRKLISSFVLIVDRQTSLACLFGLMAWLVVIRTEGRRATRSECVGLSLLLVASALGKEYGLAFATAVAAYALYDRRKDLAAAAVLALVIYAGLRVGFAAGAVAPYCEDHGYFFSWRTSCFEVLDSHSQAQAAYNIVATGAGTLLPGLFTTDGAIDISWRRLTLSALLLAVAVLGWVKGQKPIRLGLFVVGFNALQSFLLFRSRNHAVAVCAIGIAVGVGLPVAGAALRRVTPIPAVQVVALVILLGLLSMRANVTRELLLWRIEDSSSPDPCLSGIPNPNPVFLKRVWERYHVRVPECVP